MTISNKFTLTAAIFTGFSGIGPTPVRFDPPRRLFALPNDFPASMQRFFVLTIQKQDVCRKLSSKFLRGRIPKDYSGKEKKAAEIISNVEGLTKKLQKISKMSQSGV